MSENNKNRLIIIEGIPGSGKSTLTKRVHDYLKDKGVNAKAFNEGDLHPVDFAWCGYLTIAEYNDLLKKYPQHKEQIVQNSNVFADGAVTAYLNLDGVHESVIEYLKEKEIFDGKISAEQFEDLHIKRYTAFSKDAANSDETYVFECSTLQNQVNELLNFHNKDGEYIKAYCLNLIDCLKGLNPVLIYLKQNDVEKTTRKIAQKRLSPDKAKYPDWIDIVIDYISKSPYGKAHNLLGLEGTIQYLINRQNIELDIVRDMPVKTVVIENDDYDWDVVFDKIIEEIKI